MTDPSKERIATALALAEAVDAAARACDAPEGTPPDLFQRTWLARCDALAAYRATAPKLRTRAEVDAEIALLARTCVANEWAGDDDYETWEAVTRLCREETAPEEPNRVTDHDADTRELQDPEPCGCEESEALRAKLEEYRRRLKSIAELTRPAEDQRMLNIFALAFEE